MILALALCVTAYLLVQFESLINYVSYLVWVKLNPGIKMKGGAN